MGVTYTFPEKMGGQLTLWLHGQPHSHYDTEKEMREALHELMFEIVYFDNNCPHCDRKLHWMDVGEAMEIRARCICGWTFEHPLTRPDIVSIWNMEGQRIN